MPVSMIILNDIWAYVFGFFFGRTPLIQVSPKKTWEGFIGGGVATVICGIVVSRYLQIEFSFLFDEYIFYVCKVLFIAKIIKFNVYS